MQICSPPPQFYDSKEINGLEWLLADNSPAAAVAGLRRVLANGSLSLGAFPAARYRRDVHAAAYRCRLGLRAHALLTRTVHTHSWLVLSNGSLSLGAFPAARYRRDVHAAAYRCRLGLRAHALLTRTVHVHAVLNSPWEVHVPDEYVMAGNSAVLRCVSPAHAADRVAATDWLADDGLSVFDKQYLDSKYQLLDDGSLFVSAVSPADRGAFRCRVRDRVTGQHYTSQYYGHIIVTEPKGSVRPRVSGEARARRVAVGHDVRLPCAAHAWPVPTYRWFREHRETLTPLEDSSTWPRASILGGGGLLRIRGVRREDAGRFVCWLNNTAGGEAVHFTLSVTEPISVRVKPEVVRSKLKSNLTFECKISGHPVEQVHWVHDGRPLKPTERVQVSEDGLRIHISKMQKSDLGFYQCFASNSKDQAYGISELYEERGVGSTLAQRCYLHSAMDDRGPL
ncbi:hypothetical protein JYU34_014381 [Plutella xylostella]|uniref:Ig-like domain-containing protein n=1 Tax=Plutella xylostella TaxID=51655 RepID=A0ABQ7Q8F6_PLUXY|nr:hypothetical protein JYU34_014381 [Plutella xylostella]